MASSRHFDPAFLAGLFLYIVWETFLCEKVLTRSFYLIQVKLVPTETANLRIMLVCVDALRLQALLADFDCSDCRIVATATAEDDLLSKVEHDQPDVVIVDMDAPNRDSLEALRSVQSYTPRPMVMVTEDEDPDSIRRAVRAGVSAYVVGGLQQKRIRPILDAAIARFEQYRSLEKELDKTRSQLAERKVIERAKGLIMAQRKIGEPEAYRLLRKAAMDRNLRLAEVAENIVSAAELLQRS